MGQTMSALPDAPAAPIARRTRAASLPPAERRRAIVDATIPLLVEHGEQVTTRQIADAAGTAEGTIFRVFADKDAILAAAVDAALDPAPFERALEGIDPGLPLEAVVHEVVLLSLRRLADTWRLLSSVGSRTRDRQRRPMAESPTLARLLAAHRAELAVPPRAAARTLRALTFAMSHPMMVERPAPAREIVRTFLHGVSAGGDGC
jgi:AcrR family transcriptional regulator